MCDTHLQKNDHEAMIVQHHCKTAMAVQIAKLQGKTTIAREGLPKKGCKTKLLNTVHNINARQPVQDNIAK